MRDECFGGVTTTSTLSFYHILKALVGTLSLFSKFFSAYNYEDDRRTETQHGESDEYVAECGVSHVSPYKLGFLLALLLLLA